MGILSSAITFGMVLAGLGVIIALLPPQPVLPTEFIDAITTLVTYIQTWGYLINFGALLFVVKFVAGFELIIFSVRTAIWFFDEVYNRA